MPHAPVIYEDVEVISATDMTMRCRVGEKIVIVGRGQPLHGTTVSRQGDRGRLILPRWAIEDLGLPEPPSN